MDVNDFLKPPRARLVVAPDGMWFRVDGASVVSLETRRPLRKLLTALVRRHITTPDLIMQVTEAFAAGWPGNRALPKAAATRVYTAVHVLRGMGLDNILIRRGTGYIIDADVTVANEAESAPTGVAAADDDSEASVA